MDTISVTLLAVRISLELKFSFENDNSTFLPDLFSTFTDPSKLVVGDASTYKIVNPVLNTQDLRDRVAIFIIKYENQFPKVHLIKKFLRALNENDPFLFLDMDVTTEDDKDFYLRYLICQHTGENLGVYLKRENELYSELFKDYDTWLFDKNIGERIGEPDKQKRTCRFCGKKAPETTFKQKAHSISEALGNKNIITNDECDICNKKFDEEIERDIISMLDLFRSIWGVQGKNGTPTLVEKNFTANYENGITITEAIPPKDINKISSTLTEIPLRSSKKIIQQNVYRALVKFALSVVDRSIIPNFSKTIDWLRGASENSLPPIAIRTEPSYYDPHPSICVSIRKTANKDFPYAVAELRFRYMTFVYIIPFAKDDSDFSTQTAFDQYWKKFKHHSIKTGWRFSRFNSPDPEQFTIYVGVQHPETS